jgi:hypothetical protein
MHKMDRAWDARTRLNNRERAKHSQRGVHAVLFVSSGISLKAKNFPFLDIEGGGGGADTCNLRSL